MSLLKKLSKFGGKPAIHDHRRNLSYAQLYRASWALASQMTVKFRQAKVWPIEEPRVMYITNRDILHPMAQFATWHLNGICIPVSSSSTPAELDYFARNSGANMIITHKQYLKKFETIKEGLGVPIYSLDDSTIDLQTKSLLSRHGQVAPMKKDAMIIYTSGTTGNPKGVVHTHGSLESMMVSMEEAWQWSEDDHIANVLPLHHVHGIMNVLNTALWSGAQCTLIPKFDNKKMWDHLLDKRSESHYTVFMAVPTIYKKMIDYYEANNMAEQAKEIKIKLKEFRLMVCGSAALPPPQFEKWKEITGHTLLERFGMTEVGMALTNPYKDKKLRLPGHVGVEFPGVIAKLMDDSGNLHRNPDDPGELVLQSNCMFDRYLDNEKATEESFFADPSGQKWFKTGDSAILTNDSFKILGRLSQDIIKKSGYKISALEIEAVILQSGIVSEVAVFGVEDEEYGEEIVAYVALKDGESTQGAESTINAYVREQMSSYKTPRVYRFVDKLPRNQMGKVSKVTLKKEHA